MKILNGIAFTAQPQAPANHSISRCLRLGGQRPKQQTACVAADSRVTLL